MRIVVNDIAASTGGALSILWDFYSFIKDNDKDNEWIFLLGDKYIEETENIKVLALPDVKKSWLKKVLFDFFSGRKIINGLDPDRVISLQNIITFGVKAKQFVYIHQAIPFQKAKKFSFFKKSERTYAIYQHLIGRIIKRSAKIADGVIVQTEWMKNAVAEMAKADQSKIFYVHPSVNVPMELEIENDFDCRKFFYPTAKAVYKNNKCIYDACKVLNEDGYDDFHVELTIEGECVSSNVSHIGRIAREDVLRKYNQTTLILPSYIESFPLPLAEAKMLGAIILASDCPFSREVLKDYPNAYFFDPFSPRELAELMKKVLKGEIARKEVQCDAEKADSWQEILDLLVG